MKVDNMKLKRGRGDGFRVIRIGVGIKSEQNSIPYSDQIVKKVILPKNEPP